MRTVSSLEKPGGHLCIEHKTHRVRNGSMGAETVQEACGRANSKNDPVIGVRWHCRHPRHPYSVHDLPLLTGRILDNDGLRVSRKTKSSIRDRHRIHCQITNCVHDVDVGCSAPPLAGYIVYHNHSVGSSISVPVDQFQRYLVQHPPGDFC